MGKLKFERSPTSALPVPTICERSPMSTLTSCMHHSSAVPPGLNLTSAGRERSKLHAPFSSVVPRPPYQRRPRAKQAACTPSSAVQSSAVLVVGRWFGFVPALLSHSHSSKNNLPTHSLHICLKPLPRCGGKTSLEGKNSGSICYATFLVYFLTMASSAGREIMNSESRVRSSPFFP